MVSDEEAVLRISGIADGLCCTKGGRRNWLMSVSHGTALALSQRGGHPPA